MSLDQAKLMQQHYEENKLLRAALEPFAKAWTAFGDKPPDETTINDNRGAAYLEGTKITFGDLRRAHAALRAMPLQDGTSSQKEPRTRFIPAKRVHSEDVESLLKGWTLNTIDGIDKDDTIADVALRAASEAFEIICSEDHSKFVFPYEFDYSDGHCGSPVSNPLTIHFAIENQEDSAIIFASDLGEMIEYMLGSYRQSNGILWDIPSRVHEFCEAFTALADKVRADISSAQYPEKSAGPALIAEDCTKKED